MNVDEAGARKAIGPQSVGGCITLGHRITQRHCGREGNVGNCLRSAWETFARNAIYCMLVARKIDCLHPPPLTQGRLSLDNFGRPEAPDDFPDNDPEVATSGEVVLKNDGKDSF